MRLLIRIAILLAAASIPAFCQTCTVGTSNGTLDSGAITYTGCWASTYAGSCATNAAYSARTLNALNFEPKRCMALMYYTSDGINNTNDTIIYARGGGSVGPFGSGTTPDWSQSFMSANGTAKPAIYCWVEGCVTAANPGGKRFNVIVPQYTLSGVATITAGIGTSDTSFTLAVYLGSASYWPQSGPFTLYTPEGEQICVPGGGQTGSFAATYAVTGATRGCNGTTAVVHPSSDLYWPADTTGVGAWLPSSVCDEVTLLSYLAGHMGNGSVPGVKSAIWLGGWSEGAYMGTMAGLMGKSLLTSGVCNSEWADTSWTVKGVYGLSTLTDRGVVALGQTVGPTQPAPYTVTFGSSNKNIIAVSDGPDPAGAPSASSVDISSFNIAGFPPTGANTAYNLALKWSPQACNLQNSSSCIVTPDPNPPPIMVALGTQDNNIGAYQELNFCRTYAVFGCRIYYNQNHDLGMFADTTSPCSGSGGACWPGQVMQDMIAFFVSNPAARFTGFVP